MAMFQTINVSRGWIPVTPLDISPPLNTVSARNRPTLLPELPPIIAETSCLPWSGSRPVNMPLFIHQQQLHFAGTRVGGSAPLDQLPLELLQDVLCRLDMQSLFRVRQASLGARQAVDSLSQYQMVVSHGLNLFCALLRMSLATGVSLFDFYDALCTKACAFCGQFAGFMSLLTWERCCFPCVLAAPETQVQTLAAARKQLRLTKAEASQLKSLKTLPGVYSMEESTQKLRITIVSAQQAMLVGGQRQDSPELLLQPATSLRNRKLNCMGSCALPYYDRGTGRVEHGMSCAGCQLAMEKDIIGARAETWAYEARDWVYSQDGFLEHFRWCEQAQLLWRSSDEGNNQPKELPEGARRRGYFNSREG